jgi:hypothetical protein
VPAAEGSHETAVENQKNVGPLFEIPQSDGVPVEILKLKIGRGCVECYSGHANLHPSINL